MPRIYQPVSIPNGSRLRLDESASHHLARVLRARIGDELTLFNGEGDEYQASIVTIEKKYVEVEVKAFIEINKESPLALTLAQGIAKGERMDFIVQKAVELGVKRIIPLITERCNVRLDESREKKRLAHWQSVVISACEQSGRNILPEIVAPITYVDWLKEEMRGYKFVLSPHTTQPLTNLSINKNDSITVLIGPEGGLSDAEVAQAEKVGFMPLNLGPRVLRTETATLASLTFFQTLFGDMKA